MRWVDPATSGAYHFTNDLEPHGPGDEGRRSPHAVKEVWLMKCMRYASLLLLLVALMGGGSAPALCETMDVAPVTTMSLLQEAASSGRISPSQNVLYQLYALFEPAALPHEYVVPDAGPIKCGTPAVIEARQELNAMPEGMRQEAESFLVRPTLDSFIDTAHFRIHYSTSGTNKILGWPDTAYRDSVANSCEYGYGWYVAHGWPPPPPDGTGGGNSKIDCYVDNLSGVYGVTYPESPSGYYPQYPNSYTAYFVIDNDYAGFPNAPYGAMHVTVAHEYHHVIQIGMSGQIPWFMENTSTFMEDELYDQVNDNYQYLPSYFYVPWNTLRTANGAFEYACYIWPTYLKERWSHALVHDIWDNYGRNNNITNAFDQEIAAADPAYDWDKAVAEWARWNVFTCDHSDGAHYSESGQWRNSQSGACIYIGWDRDINTYPQASIHPSASKMPQGLGSNFTRFRPQTGSSDNKLTIAFTALDACDYNHVISFVRKFAGQNVWEEYVVPIDAAGNASLELNQWDRSEYLFMVVEMKRVCGSSGKDFVFNVTTTRVADVADAAQPARVLRLDQNVPNPFNPLTTIRYAISKAAPVRVDVYDAGGRHMRSLVSAVQTAGDHQVKWFGDDDAGRQVPAGMYLYSVQVGGEKATRKMLMVE